MIQIMSRYNIPAEKWLQEQFEDEFCSQCGGDAKHHTVIIVMGNWSAHCDYPPDKNGNHHTVVQAYRKNLSL